MSIRKYLEEDNNISHSLPDDIYNNIRKDILQGALSSGEKLTESVLCKEYGVSRTPLRAALARLTSDGLVETIPNRGSFVVGLSERDISDIHELRAAAEIQAVGWSIMRITEEERAALDETFEFIEFYTARNDILKMTGINMAFHRIIYEGTHNTILINQLMNYQEFLSHSDPPNYYAKDFLKTILSEHRDIYQAFVTNDPAAGRLAMKRHMENGKKRRSRV